MFPTRSRRDLKLKYKKEERTNGQLINKALLYPKAFNIQELKDQLEEEDREREENDRQWKEISKAIPGNPKKVCLKRGHVMYSYHNYYILLAFSDTAAKQGVTCSARWRCCLRKRARDEQEARQAGLGQKAEGFGGRRERWKCSRQAKAQG